MAKILTDKEVLEIVKKAVEDAAIDDMHTYERFLQDLTVLVTDYFGGVPGTAGYDDGGFYCPVHISEEVPCDGGIYKDYDTDVTWIDGKEIERIKA